MKMYAMISQGFVIGIVDNCNDTPNWGNDAFGNPVTAVVCDSSVKLGMVYNEEDGTFSEYVPPKEPMPESYQPTEGELMIMETQATMYEEMQANKLAQMEANADIYEAISALGGNV